MLVRIYVEKKFVNKSNSIIKNSKEIINKDIKSKILSDTTVPRDELTLISLVFDMRQHLTKSLNLGMNKAKK